MYAVLSQNQLCRDLRVFGVEFLSWKWCWCQKMTNIRYGLSRQLFITQALMKTWTLRQRLVTDYVFTQLFNFVNSTSCMIS